MVHHQTKSGRMQARDSLGRISQRSVRLGRGLLPENFGCGEYRPVPVGNRERLSVLAHTECPHCTEQKCASVQMDSVHGSLVKRLRHRPLTPKTGVRFPYESPLIGTPERFYIPWQLVLVTMRVHLFPSRTQKLSSFVPKILGWRRPGKIGRCQHPYSSIAQPVEHAAVNRRVVGSSPT